ncbi:MAG TPA: glutamate 5-kinase [Patescibacteria group bacterium]|nr:glutamate 5-kinase [Patescibacteria group bacterium]
MKIVIKIGTQAILASDGTLLKSAMPALVRQVAKLQQAGHRVVLVSSGAVASGRRVARESLGREYGGTLGEKQLLASLGQPELMQAYAKLFRPHGIAVAQLLLTKQDFHTRKHYLNIARLLRETLEAGNIIPIINENDSVAVEELMFTDNDELAGLIAAQLNADKLLILTSVEGVYDRNPDEAGAKIIPLINPEKDGWPKVSATKTALGRGGMASKLGTARKMSDLGVTTHIAAMKVKDVILRLADGESIGTTILPRKKRSNLKKWIAFDSARKSGVIRVNAQLYALLKDSSRALSILPVGIKACSGSFEKGDMVEVADPDGRRIGVGIARYGAEKLREHMGQKNRPELIHYDQLHIDAGGET